MCCRVSRFQYFESPAKKCHKNHPKGLLRVRTPPKYAWMDVALRNKATGKLKFHKIGWSWSCFFGSAFIGIPLFRRGLYGWGAVVVALWVIDLLSSDWSLDEELTLSSLEEGLALSAVMFLVGTGLSFFFGAKANTLAGRRYLATGWEFARPNSEEAAAARRAWGVEPVVGADPAFGDDDVM
jgi:hypothetical protein